jgi:hypothetical protein
MSEIVAGAGTTKISELSDALNSSLVNSTAISGRFGDILPELYLLSSVSAGRTRAVSARTCHSSTRLYAAWYTPRRTNGQLRQIKPVRRIKPAPTVFILRTSSIVGWISPSQLGYH